jgi:hypothetical protein
LANAPATESVFSFQFSVFGFWFLTSNSGFRFWFLVFGLQFAVLRRNNPLMFEGLNG